jgi:hypothetical protein
LSYAAGQWWNTRAQQRQNTHRPAPAIPAMLPPKQAANSLSRIEIQKAWEPALARLIDSIQVGNSPALPAKELKVLRRMVDGCKMRRVAGHWALSISADDKVKGYCKVRQGAVNHLVEGGYVAVWGDRLSLTGKGSALMGKGSVARIA